MTETSSGLQWLRLADLSRETPADHRGVAAGELERGEHLVVQHCEMAPDGGALPHAHEDHDQIFVVVAGTLRVRDGGGSVTSVRAGEAVKICAGSSHGTENGGERPASYFVLTYPAG